LYNPLPAESWREIAAHIDENKDKEEIIIFTPINQIAPFIYYFDSNRTDLLSLVYEAASPLVLYEQYGHKLVLNERSKLYLDTFPASKNFMIGTRLGGERGAIKEDFLKDVIRQFPSCSGVWLVSSPDWIGEEEFKDLKEYLLSYFDIEEKTEYSNPGVEVYRLTLKRYPNSLSL